MVLPPAVWKPSGPLAQGSGGKAPHAPSKVPVKCAPEQGLLLVCVPCTPWLHLWRIAELPKACSLEMPFAIQSHGPEGAVPYFSFSSSFFTQRESSVAPSHVAAPPEQGGRKAAVTSL